MASPIATTPHATRFTSAAVFPSFHPAKAGQKTKQTDHFYRLVVLQPAQDYSAFSNAHRLLAQDPSSIYNLLTVETSRDTFILGFQELSKPVVEFYRKLKPFFLRGAEENGSLAKALVEGIVLPLFGEQYQDLFISEEIVDLISVALQSQYYCESPPGLVVQIFSKLTMFPETKLLERLVANPVGAEIVGDLIKNQKYGRSLFDHRHSILVKWIDRLIKLSDCGFDHNITEPCEDWKSITILREQYLAAQPSISGQDSQPSFKAVKANPKNMRKLTAGDKKSGAAGKASKETKAIMIPQNLASLFKSFGSPVPRTLAEARNTVQQLELARAFGILEKIIASFPCGVCCKKLANVGHSMTHLGKHEVSFEPMTAKQEIEECRIENEGQIERQELKGLGCWRIVLSRQAMKDLADSRKAGSFKAVENKLRELASGNWGGRKALTKKHVNPDFPVPIKKAVYDDNGRIVWHVHVAFDQTAGMASQVILVWRIGDHKEVVQSEGVISRHQKTFGKQFVEACKLRVEDPRTGTVVPQIFDRGVLQEEHVIGTLSRDESLDLHNAIVTGKFYTLTQIILDGIFKSGTSAEFPFDVAHEEVEIIRQKTSSSIILGRSGTGKTTCLVFKLLGSYLASKHSAEHARPLRQIFITRSGILAGKLNDYIRKLISCQLGKFDSDQVDEAPELETIKEKDENADVTDFWSMPNDSFPLVCTYEKFLTLLERSLKVAQRKHFDDTIGPVDSPDDSQAHRRNSILRASQEVQVETFIRDYWTRFSNGLKKNIPVDLVFSEIMGTIKGSTSSLSGLQQLSREQYLSKSSRVAPLFTSEAERSRVYSVYEHYEKLKAEYRDWDGVDRTKNVFLLLQQSGQAMASLRDIIEEVYVDEIQDQRLIEIELILSLVKYPRGIHLAGDSAQCISRDSTFRINDVKKLFFEVFEHTASASGQRTLSRLMEFKLAQNYRSHQGIISLGALIIECLCNGFPDLIDKLSPEIGKYSGPKPIFFAGFKAEDVLVNQSFGLVDLYDRLADFGADQVILVRDEEAQKQIHSRIGAEVLILTVLQSKGMEFEDVVLLNFFSSSPHASHYRTLDRLINPVKYGDFEPKRHSVLCSELKTLYVAVTRCRANLRMIEEDASTAKVIVDMWTTKVQKPLIDVVNPGDADASLKITALRSGSSGNPELWLKNGRYLMEKKLFKQALFCFQKTQHKQLQTLALANLRRQEAEALAISKALTPVTREELHKLYRESAHLFLDAEHPLEASKSYEAGHLFREAAAMWSGKLRPDKAAPLYERAGDYSTAADNYHLAQMYAEATRALRRGALYEDLVEYLERVKDDLDPVLYQRSSRLCNLLAHQGKLAQSYKTRSLRLLGSDLKIEMFYRQRGYTEDLLDLFRSQNRIKDAFQYLTSIGKVTEAVLFAPFDDMKSQIELRELSRMQQLLLISDLRTTIDGKSPVYALEHHPCARPGMNLLWDALYRRLTYLLRLNKSALKREDYFIDGYAGTKEYLDIVALERMEETLGRVHELGMLPLDAISYGLEVARLLYFSREKVPDVAKRYVGAYKHGNRASYNLLHASPLVSIAGGPMSRQLSEEQLLRACRKWFGRLIVKSSFMALEKAFTLWNRAKSSTYCPQQALSGKCSKISTGAWPALQCPYQHSRPGAELDVQALNNYIHQLARIMSKLKIFYGHTPRQVMQYEEDLMKDFRPRQRRWLEALFAELTYISAARQDPTMIELVPVFNTHLEKNKEYRWLRDDLQTLARDIHLEEEWSSRNSFSELLEQVQRSEQLGTRAATHTRITISGLIKRTLRDRNLDEPKRQGLELFNRRPILQRNFHRRADFPSLTKFFKSVAALETSQLQSFHAVLFLYERIATYLLLLGGERSGFLIATSWIEVHMKQLRSVYSSYHHRRPVQPLSPMQAMMQTFGFSQRVNDPLRDDSAAANACLLDLARSLLDLTEKFFKIETHKFKLGGDRGSTVPKQFILRRCFDVICICIINLSSVTPWPAYFATTWENLMFSLASHGSWMGIRPPQTQTKESFLQHIHDAFAVYRGREGITLVTTPGDDRRFALYSAVIQRCRIPTVTLEEVRPLQDFVSQHQEAVDDEAQEQLFNAVERQAAEVIARIWREYWPRAKKRRQMMDAPLGRATIAMDKLYHNSLLRLEDLETRYPEHHSFIRPMVEDMYFTFWLHAPEIYQRVTFAEGKATETSERYQNFFTSLLGTNYTDADLERVEEYFEEVELHIASVAEMRKIFSDEGLERFCWNYCTFAPQMHIVELKKALNKMGKEAELIVEHFERLSSNKYVKKIL
ncbi:hypothetical protein BDZ91DRAFT_737945 [Kalaharituber pfeilii]|nr:hypothetical protein BDZ91DRAFT_737945 [Kalaharituber pfeilii]